MQTWDFYLRDHATKDGHVSTHTRIPSEHGKTPKIYGGTFHIPEEKIDEFNDLYYNNVFVNKHKEHLTERQLEDSDNLNGPILVDFDFRYNQDITTKQHTEEHLQDIINEYLEELKNVFIFNETTPPFNVYIFEKPNVNIVPEKNITKDGIHMLISIQANHTIQLMIRKQMLTALKPMFEGLPLINDLDSILDIGISKGCTNWQMFGSRKPYHEAYQLIKHYEYTYDANDTQFSLDEKTVEPTISKDLFIKLLARNTTDNIILDVNTSIKSQLNSIKKEFKNKKPALARITIKHNNNTDIDTDNDGDKTDDETDGVEKQITIKQITNKVMLDKAVEQMLARFKEKKDYHLCEIHEYTQTLPQQFYEPGSHYLNQQVAFALKNTDEHLFLSWIMLRSKASDFNYGDILSKYDRWKNYFNQTSQDTLTKKSIIYWSKQYAYADYLNVKKNTVSFHLEQSLYALTEYDIAQVLYQVYKDEYVCNDPSHKIWYRFSNHRWILDDRGLTLRNKLSTSIFKLYEAKQFELMNERIQKQMARELEEHHKQETAGVSVADIINVVDNQKGKNAKKDDKDPLDKKIASVAALMIKLKKTSDKNNIMHEAIELFHDPEFNKKVDENKELLGFTNGVIDFKNKCFRDGQPQDYISKTTNIKYIRINPDNTDDAKIVSTIKTFFDQIFPINDLNTYMWEHFASCLIGTNINQTFNIYVGNGANGKSMVTELMEQVLGEYYGKCPIELVTGQKQKIGGTSSEVANLKGIRYAPMQEAPKGAQLNEASMKELTGDKNIQARQLFQESMVFDIQFKLVVCTNNLFDVNSNDDGTWRRIRICEFLSKFCYPDERFKYVNENKYVFDRDDTIRDKFKTWAPYFMSMLIDIAFRTNGKVNDCSIVTAASNNYRAGQDYLCAFVTENLELTNIKTDKLQKRQLGDLFKEWFKEAHNDKALPKIKELYEYIDKKFIKFNNGYWSGVKIKSTISTEEQDLKDGVENE